MKVAISWWIVGLFVFLGTGTAVQGSLPWNVPESISLYAAGALLTRAWARNLDRRGGMTETPTALRLGAMGSKPKLLRWESIACFDHSHVWPRHFVLAIAPNGRVCWIRNTRQGTRIAWDGGETRDIVGVLNERLGEWRAQNDVEPPVLPELTSDGPIEKLGTGVRLQMLVLAAMIAAGGLVTIFAGRT